MTASGLGALPPEVQEQSRNLYELAMSHPHKGIARLETLVDQYPPVPALKNWLAVAYLQAGRQAEADAMEERIWREHPDYFFGRISRAYRCMNDGELDRVPEVLGGLDLKQMYPHRDVFHVSEALTLWALLADWYYQQGEDDEALDHLDWMLEVDPDHHLTARTEVVLAPLILRETMAAMFEERRPRKQVKSKAKSKSARRKRPGAGGERDKRNSPDDVNPAPAPLPRNAC
jgi:tetratricopeptide (TPR) repeat protein